MVVRIRRTSIHCVRLFVENTERAWTGGTRRSMATVYLGLGSNVGDRPANIMKAYEGLRGIGQVDATSFLYETVPMYLEDQPRFLNTACRLLTELGPVDLLERVKNLETAIGRKQSARWGPRAVDIDILVYDRLIIDEAGTTDGRDDDGFKGRQRWLQVPHPKMHERPFVLLPLMDIEPELVHPILGSTVKELLGKVLSPKYQRSGVGGQRVLPMGVNSGDTRLWPFDEVGSRTCVMGILNTTPDSFSDGGLHNGMSAAIDHGLKMVRDGADIVDIGGESTRPGAADVTEEAEISRVVPIVEGLRRAALDDENNQFSISVDTRRASVAEAALAAGAHLVNDVSGGTFDPGMLAAVAKARVPLVMMHMRGTPKTMKTLTDYGGDVVDGVCNALEERTRAAESVGVPRWMHILDPGIGFAKTNLQSLELLRSLDTVARRVRSPLLVGPSRKRFIGEIFLCGVAGAPLAHSSGYVDHPQILQLTGEQDPSERDWGTAGACCSATDRGARIVRVHNVRGVRQALDVSDAVRDSSR